MSAQTRTAEISADAPSIALSGNKAIPTAFWAKLALPVLLAWQMMVLLDATIVNIALSDIRQSLDFSATGLSWVVNSYALAFGGMLLLGGRAGDILGRRRMLVIGVLVFTAASFFGGLSPNSSVLLISRILQGVGAAMAAPSTLSLIYTNFHEAESRSKAISYFSAISGVGASLGLVLGGVITSALSWHWVFFINVPIGIAVAYVAPRALRESQLQPGKFDFAGAIFSTVGVASVVYGFIRAAEQGWTDSITMASFAVGVALLIGLVIAESRVEQPIMPLAMFRNRNRMVALVNMLLISSAMFGIFFFLTQFLQVVHGFSPLRSGLAFLPMSMSILAASRIAPMAMTRLGSRALMTLGAAFFAAALLWLSQATMDGNYWTQIFFPFILLGFGGGFSFMPMNLTIMSSLRPEQTGAGAGTLQTFQQVGGAIGLAVLVTIFSTRQDNALTDGMSALAAMTEGVQGGFLAASAIALVAVLLVGFGITSRTSAEGSPATTVVVDAH
jgi:EmrB/QacA subfamily drug resistance transporter